MGWRAGSRGIGRTAGPSRAVPSIKGINESSQSKKSKALVGCCVPVEKYGFLSLNRKKDSNMACNWWQNFVCNGHLEIEWGERFHFECKFLDDDDDDDDVMSLSHTIGLLLRNNLAFLNVCNVGIFPPFTIKYGTRELVGYVCVCV